MIAIDYGAKSKLVFWGPQGRVEIPPRTFPNVKGGCTPAFKFSRQVAWLLDRDDIVFENSTPGTSGAERELIAKVAANAGNRVWLVSARAVKNYYKDHPEEAHPTLTALYTDIDAVRAIYKIAQDPRRRYEFTAELRPRLGGTGRRGRDYQSVRPYDKRLYRDEMVDDWMSLLPDFSSLSDMTRIALSNTGGAAYSIPLVLPFAMALDEGPYRETPVRRIYERILGLYEMGCPSFYRRATVELMQKIAKQDTGKDHIADVTPSERKKAWKKTQKIVRELHSKNLVRATDTTDS